MRKFFLVAGILGVNLAWMAVVSADVRNCDSNAVIYCGAMTQAELTQKLQNGDGRHTGGQLTWELAARGVKPEQVSQSVDGQVTRDGRVIVAGQTVATGALTYGRLFIPGSTQNGDLWQRPPSVSFRNDSLTALVYMSGGRFGWAVLKSCGNPVVATPVPPPPPPPPPAKPVVIKTVVVKHVVYTPPPPPPAAPLPATGASGVMLGLIGFGLMVFTGVAFYGSRQRLKLKMLDQ